MPFFFDPRSIKHKENADRIADLLNWEETDIFEADELARRDSEIRKVLEDMDELEILKAYEKQA